MLAKGQSFNKKTFGHKEGAREDFQRCWSYFPAISKPIIAAVNGPTVGLGFILTLYCDVRIASDQARFSTAFSKRGLIAEHGIAWMLPRLIGISNALDLLYSARTISAEEALRMNLVRIPMSSDTQSGFRRTPYPIEIGHFSERSDAGGSCVS